MPFFWFCAVRDVVAPGTTFKVTFRLIGIGSNRNLGGSNLDGFDLSVFVNGRYGFVRSIKGYFSFRAGDGQCGGLSNCNFGGRCLYSKRLVYRTDLESPVHRTSIVALAVNG